MDLFQHFHNKQFLTNHNCFCNFFVLTVLALFLPQLFTVSSLNGTTESECRDGTEDLVLQPFLDIMIKN